MSDISKEFTKDYIDAILSETDYFRVDYQSLSKEELIELSLQAPDDFKRFLCLMYLEMKMKVEEASL